MIKIKFKRYARIIAVILLLIFLFNIKLFAPVRSFLVDSFNPLLRGAYVFGNLVNRTYEGQLDRKDLLKENQELRSQLNETMAENAKLKTLEEENASLRDFHKFYEQHKIRYLLANTISISDQSGSDQYIVIDKGSKDGLEAGLLAVNKDGVAVGKLREVKDDIAVVEMLSSDKCKLAVAANNTGKTTGLTRGELGLTINMDFIPLTENIETGNLIMTSGLEKNIPRGIIVGKVVKVEKGNNQLWQNAVIEPLVKPNELLIVSVILP